MSYINEALKKVQQEKDTHSLKYGDFLAQKENRIMLSGNGIRYSLFLSAPLLLCAVFLYIRWHYKDVRPPEVIMEQHESSEAVIKNKEASAENVPDTVALYENAGEFFRQGQLDSAKRFYLKVLDYDPGHIDTLNNIGFICLHDGDYTAAKKYFEKAIRLNPAHVDTYYNMACLHAINKDSSQGLIYLKKAISMEPSAVEWARKDPDLEGLKSLPEFQEMIGK